jgi:hypothetical protein
MPPGAARDGGDVEEAVRLAAEVEDAHHVGVVEAARRQGLAVERGQEQEPARQELIHESDTIPSLRGQKGCEKVDSC